MKEKIRISILGICLFTLISMTYAVSVKDYKTKDQNLNSSSMGNKNNTNKFICTYDAISPTSKETIKYEKNKINADKILEKIIKLWGDKKLTDPCNWKKWKAKTECNINNVELLGALRQLKKINIELNTYEECLSKHNDWKKPDSKKDWSKAHTADENETITVSGVSRWYEGEWSECNNGSQEKKVECRLNNKKVADTSCEWKKPITWRACTKSSSSNTDNIDAGNNKKEQCGNINVDSFDMDAKLSGKDDKVLQCFSDNIVSCSPWSISINDKEIWDISFEVHGKKWQSCSISVLSDEYRKKCNVPSRDINSILLNFDKEKIPTSKLPIIVGTMILFDKDFNDQVDPEYRVTCQEFINDELVTTK